MSTSPNPTPAHDATPGASAAGNDDLRQMIAAAAFAIDDLSATVCLRQKYTPLWTRLTDWLGENRGE